jgi:L-ornithine Nalpha-acyltransferase
MIERSGRPVEAVRTSTRIVDLQAGSLGVRLAESIGEVDAAQALRFRIFYEEMGATPDDAMARAHRDFDDFDDVCDHLLVLDNSKTGRDAVVATYRLIRREHAQRLGRFYSASEFDISNVLSWPGEVLELGRSCVDQDYRSRAAMQLLWRGIAAYVFHHEIELMFGCASLPGQDPNALALPLSYLQYHHLAPPALRPRALDALHVQMRRLSPKDIEPAKALAELPPLIKGYLRLGGFVGDGAVIDRQFNTTDVSIVVKTDLVTEKYYKHDERQTKDVWAA